MHTTGQYPALLDAAWSTSVAKDALFADSSSSLFRKKASVV